MLIETIDLEASANRKLIFLIYKTYTMSRQKGKPSGINKSESGTGVPSNVKPDGNKSDDKLTRQYTHDDEKINEGVRQRHPNRNVDKENATNAHGYKN